MNAWLATLRLFPLGNGAPGGDLMDDYEELRKYIKEIVTADKWMSPNNKMIGSLSKPGGK